MNLSKLTYNAITQLEAMKPSRDDVESLEIFARRIKTTRKIIRIFVIELMRHYRVYIDIKKLDLEQIKRIAEDTDFYYPHRNKINFLFRL